jgi:hypothetical protein
MSQIAEPVSAQSQTLAALLEHWRVRAERTQGVVRVHVPPVRGIADLPRKYWWVLYPLIGIAFASLAAIKGWVQKRGDAYLDEVTNAAIYLSMALAIVGFAIYRLRRYIVIEVSPNELRVIHVQRRKARYVRAWKRSEIGSVHMNASNGKLLIPIPGHDFQEVYLTESQPVNEWICNEVVRAMQNPVLEQEQDGKLWYATQLTDVKPLPERKRRKELLLRIALGLIVVGALLLLTPAAPIGFLLFAASSIPAGLAMGTQEKDFYWF